MNNYDICTIIKIERMKKIVMASFIVLSAYVSAQSIGQSPYASFNIGDVKYNNDVTNNSMGKISTAYVEDFNNRFNFENPAANSNLELTTFDIQVSNENQYLSTDNDAKTTKHSSYLSNIALGIPISHQVKIGVRFQPYSSKKYDFTSYETVNSNSLINHFYGEGGISVFQTAISYNITPQFSLGARANYYFGTVKDIQEITQSNTEVINGIEISKKMKKWNFTLGSTYQAKLKNNYNLTFGASYTALSKNSLKETSTNSTYLYINRIKTRENIIGQTEQTINDFIPQVFSFGIGLGKDSKWFISSQIDYNKNKNTFSTTSNNIKIEYKDNYRLALGGWIMPNYNNFRNYFSRVIYRYGIYYEKGSLIINRNSIDQYGLTLGTSLPFSSSNILKMSSLDLGLEIGRRGTKKSNLISENFLNLKIAIHFADKWFNKRQYD